MSAEEQAKAEWIEGLIERLLEVQGVLHPSVRMSSIQMRERAEAAWQKRNEDGPDDAPGMEGWWSGGIAWNH